tara:strand:- start:85 stop:717 length:633 start_codon:yes stop_codon:yes gene_type:complete
LINFNYYINKFDLFINKNENFNEAYIIFINLDKKYYFYHLNKDKKLNFENIYLHKNPMEFDFINKFIEINFKNKFDYIFIINKNTDRDQIKNEEIEQILEKFGRNGTKVFIDLKNKQNLKNYILKKFFLLSKNNKYLKRSNLFINKEILIYDYFYSNFSLFDNCKTYNKRDRNMSYYINKLLGFIDYQRFYFLAKSVFVKYYYVKLPINR